MSRQREWQLKRAADGNCVKCGKPAIFRRVRATGELRQMRTCEAHARYDRMRHHKARVAKAEGR